MTTVGPEVTKGQRDLIAVLLAAAPGFTRWVEQTGFGRFDETPHEQSMTLASYVVDLEQQAEHDEVAAIFDAVEAGFLIDPDDRYDILTTGFMETLQTVAGNRGLDTTRFQHYLGPHTFSWWDRLDDGWGDQTMGLSRVENWRRWLKRRIRRHTVHRGHG